MPLFQNIISSTPSANLGGTTGPGVSGLYRPFQSQAPQNYSNRLGAGPFSAGAKGSMRGRSIAMHSGNRRKLFSDIKNIRKGVRTKLKGSNIFGLPFASDSQPYVPYNRHSETPAAVSLGLMRTSPPSLTESNANRLQRSGPGVSTFKARPGVTGDAIQRTYRQSY